MRYGPMCPLPLTYHAWFQNIKMVMTNVQFEASRLTFMNQWVA